MGVCAPALCHARHEHADGLAVHVCQFVEGTNPAGRKAAGVRHNDPWITRTRC